MLKPAFAHLVFAFINFLDLHSVDKLPLIRIFNYDYGSHAESMHLIGIVLFDKLQITASANGIYGYLTNYSVYISICKKPKNSPPLPF